MRLRLPENPATALARLTLNLAVLAFCAHAEVTAYPEYAGAPRSTYCTVTADGIPVFVHSYKEISYAHFAFTGEVTVAITAPAAIGSFEIHPRPYGIQATRSGATLTFKLDKPRKLIISLTGPYRYGSPALYLFAEDPEVNPPRPGDPNVKNIMDYGVDNTGGTEITAKVNQALTEVAALPGGGVVYVPRGKYKCGSIIMKSKSTLYVEGGAYMMAEGATQMTPVTTQSSHRNSNVFVGFPKDVVDAHVIGRGTFDWANKTHGYTFAQARRCSMEGVILKNSAHWTVSPVNCDSITLKNIKILNHSLTSGGYTDDAINVDVCRDVLIEDIFAFCVDDVTTSMGTESCPMLPIYNYTIRNCVATSSFRFHLIKGGAAGSVYNEDKYEYIRNLVIEGCHHVVNPGEGGPIFLYVIGDGADGRTPAYYAEGIRIRNCSTTGSLGILAVGGVGYTFRDWTVENFTQYPAVLSQFGNTGFILEQGTPVEDITFKCYTIGGKPLLSAADCAAAKYTLTGNVDITFLPCDAPAAIRPSEGGVLPGPMEFIAGQRPSISMDHPGKYRLLVFRPDGRAVDGRQSADAFPNGCGVYFLQPVDDMEAGSLGDR